MVSKLDISIQLQIVIWYFLHYEHVKAWRKYYTLNNMAVLETQKWKPPGLPTSFLTVNNTDIDRQGDKNN